jgi:hypothetical protein
MVITPNKQATGRYEAVSPDKSAYQCMKYTWLPCSVGGIAIDPGTTTQAITSLAQALAAAGQHNSAARLIELQREAAARIFDGR